MRFRCSSGISRKCHFYLVLSVWLQIHSSPVGIAQLQQSAFLDLVNGRTYATERSSNFTYLKTPPTSIVQHHTNTAPKFPFAQIARFPWFFSCLHPAYSTRPATSQRLLACLLAFFPSPKERRFANGVLACFSTFSAKIHYITIFRYEGSSSLHRLPLPTTFTYLLACLRKVDFSSPYIRYSTT